MRPLLKLLVATSILSCSLAGSPITDPIGDSFGVSPVQIDISSHSALSGGVARFFLIFGSSITPPSAGLANSLVGFIDIDVDRNAATGGPPWSAIFSPPPLLTMGMDIYVDLGSEALHPGLVDIFASDNSLLHSVPISFGGTSLSLSFPLNGPGDTFDYAIVVGTLLEPTDRAPNGEFPSESTFAPVPEPGTLTLAALALGFMAVLKRRAKLRSAPADMDTRH